MENQTQDFDSTIEPQIDKKKQTYTVQFGKDK